MIKRIVCSACVLAMALSLGHAESTDVPTDVLGAHLNYGRGCSACHSPHSAFAGNGRMPQSDPSSAAVGLWGEDATGLDGQTIPSGDGNYVETPTSSKGAKTPDVDGVLACLSCHDGNLAPRVQMRNQVYEELPPTYGESNTIPTLLGELGGANGNYFSHHPVGLGVVIDCAKLGWDCTQSEGIVSMTGARSSQFVRNYGLFIKPGDYDNRPVVVCTTCHSPHLMNTVAVGPGVRSGLPAGHYVTMFFLRGPYNPASTTQGNNQAAQFCRQCHGDMSNEMSGSSARTVL